MDKNNTKSLVIWGMLILVGNPALSKQKQTDPKSISINQTPTRDQDNQPSKDEPDSDDESQNDLLELSLEELAQVEVWVPAAITKMKRPHTPASTTLITAADIRHTPARNIYDLIEVYVPDAIWLNHEEGPHPGIRGNIVDRNYKYLLILNGRVLNSKAHFGAKSELEQWDLSDIRQIEIVRGPGSVTYGPGAVAGVISIETHEASSRPGLRLRTGAVLPYNSFGLSGQYGYQSPSFSAYVFGSLTRTWGSQSPHFKVTNDNLAGFVGDDLPNDEQPLAYFSDHQDQPQVKFHVDMSFLEYWRLWFRFTQQGATWRGNEVKTNFDGNYLNQASVADRQALLTLQYERKPIEGLWLSMMLSLDSFDAERRFDQAYHPDPDHALNKRIDFAENELNFRCMLNWKPLDWAQLAIGVEYSYDYFTKGWGDDLHNMRLGEKGIIVHGPTSAAMEPGNKGSADKDGNPVFVGKGWQTHTYSLFAEANATLSRWFTLLVSGRLDKNTHSEFLFSPRVALFSEVANGHYVKLITQRSLRMNTASQQLIETRTGSDPQPETLHAIEAVYSAYFQSGLSFNLAGFFNAAEVIAWNENINQTTSVGMLRLFGIEPEAFYQWPSGKAGISYTYVKQLDWTLADGVTLSGISYSDYNYTLRNSEAVFVGTGNDLNNWPNQSLKFYARLSLREWLVLHVDGRLFWDYQGAKDGLIGLRNAVAGLPQEEATLQSVQRVEEEDAFELDFRTNVALTVGLKQGISFHLYLQNAIGANNKRYSYDEGINKPAAHRVRFTSEPFSMGFRLEYRH